MKKILIIPLLVFLCTACNETKDTSNNLRCERTDTISENNVIEVITATFENDNIKSADMKIETKIADKYLEYKDNLEAEIRNNYKDYYDKNGIDINITMLDNGVSVKINVDFSILDDASKDLIGLSSTISTYEETKNALEGSGYICR